MTRPYLRNATLEEKLAFYSEPYVRGRCQLWLGGRSEGYGMVSWQGEMIRVQRAVWEVERGPIPKGMCVLHRCDNPPCRNIDHLFLGTDADNRIDKLLKKRQSRGEESAQAKLTEAEVMEIRALSLTTSDPEIAAIYGVGQTTIQDIRARRTWAHLD